VESESEVALLEERATRKRIRARVALRVNPDVFAETHPYISTGLREHKFGIDMQVARPVYQQVKRSRYLDPVGISVHIGSQIRTAEPFGSALDGVALVLCWYPACCTWSCSCSGFPVCCICACISAIPALVKTIAAKTAIKIGLPVFTPFMV